MTAEFSFTKERLEAIASAPMGEARLRALLVGASGCLAEYAISAAFDFDDHIEVLRPIVQGIERLQAILDAEKETKQ